MSAPLKVLALTAALGLLACSQESPADPASSAAADATAATADASADAAMPAGHAMAAAAATADVPAPGLQSALRAMWNGHVVHTREYAMAVHAGDQAAADAAAEAVVANAVQISDAVAGFYGEAGGARMLELLGGHWGAVKALTDAGDAGDTAARNKAIADLTANAGEIATFLAAANPHLPEDAVRGLLVAHGGHHIQQVQQVMAGDTAAEADTWVAMQAHMDVIADALAGAIAKQFPDKVS